MNLLGDPDAVRPGQALQFLLRFDEHCVGHGLYYGYIWLLARGGFGRHCFPAEGHNPGAVGVANERDQVGLAFLCLGPATDSAYRASRQDPEH